MSRVGLRVRIVELQGATGPLLRARRGDIGTVEAENVVDGRVLVRMDWAPEGATERWWLKDREVEAI